MREFEPGLPKHITDMQSAPRGPQNFEEDLLEFKALFKQVLINPVFYERISKVFPEMSDREFDLLFDSMNHTTKSNRTIYEKFMRLAKQKFATPQEVLDAITR